MDDRDARETIAQYEARYWALRDIVTRLLAYHAQTAPDPIERLNEFSEAGGLRANQMPPSGRPNMQMAAVIQAEFDRIIAGARALLGAEE